MNGTVQFFTMMKTLFTNHFQTTPFRKIFKTEKGQKTFKFAADNESETERNQKIPFILAVGEKKIWFAGRYGYYLPFPTLSSARKNEHRALGARIRAEKKKTAHRSCQSCTTTDETCWVALF